MSPQVPADDVSARLYAAVQRALDHLEAQLRVVQVRLDELPEGGFDEALARAGSALARAVKDCSGEYRQLEKHDRKMTLTPEQQFAELLKFVDHLPYERFDALAERIDQLRASRRS